MKKIAFLLSSLLLVGCSTNNAVVKNNDNQIKCDTVYTRAVDSETGENILVKTIVCDTLKR